MFLLSVWSFEILDNTTRPWSGPFFYARFFSKSGATPWKTSREGETKGERYESSSWSRVGYIIAAGKTDRRCILLTCEPILWETGWPRAVPQEYNWRHAPRLTEVHSPCRRTSSCCHSASPRAPAKWERIKWNRKINWKIKAHRDETVDQRYPHFFFLQLSPLPLRNPFYSNITTADL